MGDVRYNLQFGKLCAVLRLGELLGRPLPLPGGFSHRMYAIETEQGKYAVKALNPQVMQRPEVVRNFIRSEQIAGIAARKIPALPARIFKDTVIPEVDVQFYLVFDWTDGKSLKPNEITAVHCEKIGAILAGLHRTDFSEAGLPVDEVHPMQPTDWGSFLQKGRKNHSVWADALDEVMDRLSRWESRAYQASIRLASARVISHRDLDPKNVLWEGDSPLVIDWEAAGYVHPVQELVETAVYWSENEAGAIDKERFLAFTAGYRRKYGAFQINWKAVLEAGFSARLEWLEYNLKRSLRMDCTDREEQQVGNAQAAASISTLARYSEMIPVLEKWLDEMWGIRQDG